MSLPSWLGLFVHFLMSRVVLGQICTHCTCDIHSRTVTCNSPSLLIRTVSLLPSAEQLHLQGLRLPQLPHFLFHTGLRVLRINNCGLTELSAHSLLPLPNLETLNLANNNLVTLPMTVLRSLKRLKVINLANNRISDLSKLSWVLSDGLVLEQLDLSGNPLALSNRFSLLPPVHQLLMSNTNLQKINSTSLLLLPSISCPADESCRIMTFDEKDLHLLTKLDVSHNSKLTVDYSALGAFSRISYLDFAGVSLPAAFAEWLESKSAVAYLNVSSALIPLDGVWKSCSERLNSLDISSLRLHSIELNKGCPLKTLFAQDNLLTSIRIEAIELQTLHLDRNMFTEFPSVPPGISLDSLNTMSFTNNLLTVLHPNALHHMPSLQHLDLSRNQISEIDPQAFPSLGMQLISLDLSSNQLTSLPHPVLPSLLYLDASSNNLVDIDPVLFSGLPLLQHLRLSSNPMLFSKCDHEGQKCWSNKLDELTSLIDLDVAQCNLEFTLPLAHLKSLRSLILRGNSMRFVDARRMPQSLRVLDLGENRIQYTANISRLGELRDLRIDQNPLRCDCSLHEVMPHLLNQSLVTDPNLYYCYVGNWQYPLLPYLSSIRPCSSALSRSVVPVLISVMAISLVVICMILLVFIVLKRYSMGMGTMYKRLATDLPVRL